MFRTDVADKDADILCGLYIFHTFCGLRDDIMKLALCTFSNLYLKRCKTTPNIRLSVLTRKKQNKIRLHLYYVRHQECFNVVMCGRRVLKHTYLLTHFMVQSPS
jgi:hypothetical protein